MIGTRGHTGLTRLIHGSVARKVLEHARCSIFVERRRQERMTRLVAYRGCIVVSTICIVWGRAPAPPGAWAELR